MKLMDEVAGIVAARHCKTNIVTASVDAINFHDKIRKGKRSPCEDEGAALWGSWCHFTLCLHLLSDCVPQKQEDRAVLCPSHTHTHTL